MVRVYCDICQREVNPDSAVAVVFTVATLYSGVDETKWKDVCRTCAEKMKTSVMAKAQTIAQEEMNG